MRLKKLMFCAMAMLLVVGFYGNVWAGGGPEDNACLEGDLPAPASGEFLRGNFIVNMDQGTYDNYNASFILKYDDGADDGELIYHMYSWFLSLGGDEDENGNPIPPKNLCEYTDADLEAAFSRAPCAMNVGADFELEGTPVIKKIRVKKVDNCDIGNGPKRKTMIKGRVVVRVVPDPPAAP